MEFSIKLAGSGPIMENSINFFFSWNSPLVILFEALPLIYIFLISTLFQYKIISWTFNFHLQGFFPLSLTFLVFSRLCTLIGEVSRPSSGSFPSSRLLFHTPTIFLEIKVQQRTSTPAPPPKLEKNAILNIPHTQAVTRKPSCIYRTFGQHCYWSGLSLAYQLTWLHLFSPGPK